VNGRVIEIGSRGSALALAQASLVHDALGRRGHRSRVTVIETQGDRRAPDTAWGEGAFVAAIERALLDGRVDIAVHSAKDIPTDEDPRLRIAAFLPRADARDALVVREGQAERHFADLPTGARVGTDSPRRTGFLRARRPDLLFHPLHGNVDTRLRRLDSGETDALILACAGLERLGLAARIGERLGPEIVPPAPGQAAIAVQVRSDDEQLLATCRAIDDRPTRVAVEAERSFLHASGGGCRSPIGAFARLDGTTLDLLGGHARVNGSQVVVGRQRGSGTEPVELGRRLAAELALHERVATDPGRPGAPAPRVLVTRAAGQAPELLAAMRDAGLDPLLVPAIEIELAPGGSDIDRAARVLHTYRWVVITSANGAQAILHAAERVLTQLGVPSWAAIGDATRAVLEREGIAVDFQPREASAAAMAANLPLGPGDEVLVVRGDLADGSLAATLRERGADVDDVVAYRTREAPTGSQRLLRAALDAGPIDAIVFTSGSTVRGLRTIARAESVDVSGIPAVCIGAATADTAAVAGFRVLAVAQTPDAVELARTTAAALTLQLQEMS
jgi:hydroxymethylbilane synthase